MVRQHICGATPVVRDYDEAKAWYCDVPGFDLVEGTLLAGETRWVFVALERLWHP